MSEITTRQVTEEEFERIDKVARPIIEALRLAELAFGQGTAIQALTMIATEIIVNAKMKPGHQQTELADHLAVAIRKSVEANVKLLAAEIAEREAAGIVTP